jgi:hypothetical protein
MKRFLSITVLLSCLLSSTEMHELLRIPVLIYHYLEHRHHAPLSISGFLDIHYFAGDEHHHTGEGDHHDLPFETHQDLMVSNPFVATMLPVSFTLLITAPVFQKPMLYAFSDNAGLNFFRPDIWQPPRIG